MKLIYIKNSFVVAEFFTGETKIYDRILAKEMEFRGVMIPPPLREEYGGKSNVRLSDPQFQKAFKEIYTNQAFSPKNYRWETN